MNLIIDVGNSFVKIAVFQEGELLKKEISEKSGAEKKIQEFFKNHPEIGHTIVSSVSGASFVLPEMLWANGPVVELNATTKLPFENLYATPHTLGNDRKALVAAASKYFKNLNVLVIDAGTCLTFDFKNDLNEYLGGAISPGLHMRFKALHSFTANLPLLVPQEDVGLIGNTTVNSMNTGVVRGMCSEIEGAVSEYEAHYKKIKIIFTGGDAHFLSKRLKNGIFANSNFLLEGLNYILEFNKNQ